MWKMVLLHPFAQKSQYNFTTLFVFLLRLRTLPFPLNSSFSCLCTWRFLKKPHRGSSSRSTSALRMVWKRRRAFAWRWTPPHGRFLRPWWFVCPFFTLCKKVFWGLLSILFKANRSKSKDFISPLRFDFLLGNLGGRLFWWPQTRTFGCCCQCLKASKKSMNPGLLEKHCLLDSWKWAGWASKNLSIYRLGSTYYFVLDLCDFLYRAFHL